MEIKQVANFNVSIPKSAKTLAKFVSKKESFPAMQHIAIIPDKGLIAASDTRILQVFNAECKGEWPKDRKSEVGSMIEFSALVNPKQFIKFAGQTVNVKAWEYEIEKETKDRYNRKTKTTLTNSVVEIDGVEVYNGPRGKFPDVMRVIPKKEGRKQIKLDADNLEALKKICKIHKSDEFIVIATQTGSNALIVRNQRDYSDIECTYKLKMDTPAESDLVAGLAPTLLSTTLESCNGTILVDDESHPIMVEDNALATIQMPIRVEYLSEQAIEKAQKANTPIYNTVDDIAFMREALSNAAHAYWQTILECFGKHLVPGKYTAKEVAGMKKVGFCTWPDKNGFSGTFKHQTGGVSVEVAWRSLFALLAAWEAVSKAKSVFSVGNAKDNRKEKAEEDQTHEADFMFFM